MVLCNDWALVVVLDVASDFENESTFFKKNHILKMKAYSKTHFENEDTN